MEWTVNSTEQGWAVTAPGCPTEPHSGSCGCRLFITEVAATEYAAAMSAQQDG